MSESNPVISRRRLLQGAGAMWLLSVSGVGLAASSHIVAVRIWPSSSYSRLTIESSVALKYKQFALSHPERVVIDIENLHLNRVLKGVGQLVQKRPLHQKRARRPVRS